MVTLFYSDGINVDDCDVVKEYLESGRADEKADSKEKCTFAQVSRKHGQIILWIFILVGFP